MERLEEPPDPIILPRPEDIDRVIERAPGMVKDLIRAAMKTGAREEELLRARRDKIDHGRRQITLTGKRNKRRTIDLEPFAGYDLIRSLPSYVGSRLLFWHSAGESYKNFASQFVALVRRTGRLTAVAGPRGNVSGKHFHCGAPSYRPLPLARQYSQATAPGPFSG
jgi:integrase